METENQEQSQEPKYFQGWTWERLNNRYGTWDSTGLFPLRFAIKYDGKTVILRGQY